MQKKIHEVDFRRPEMKVAKILGVLIGTFRDRSAADGGWLVFRPSAR